MAPISPTPAGQLRTHAAAARIWRVGLTRLVSTVGTTTSWQVSPLKKKVLEASWGHLSRLGGHLGRLGGILEAILAVLEAILGVLEASWAVLGPSWGRLGGLLGRHGAILEASWAILEASWNIRHHRDHAIG